MQSEAPVIGIAILYLMMNTVLARRLNQLGQLDDMTVKRIRHLVKAAKAHAHLRNGDCFDDLFAQIEENLDAGQ